MKENTELRERLAALEHEQWSGWMSWLFSQSTRNDDGSVTIPAPLVTRWLRQIATHYAALTEAEQESDRAEADKVLELIKGGM